MTMADICVSHSRFCPLELQDAEFAIAHCNFHLRPGDCDLDEKLVREWAEGHCVPFFKKDFDTQSYASGRGISIEMAARDLRYAWFAELCETEGFDAVAVAHNANDNAETLMLNLLRGTGIRGLCGMDPSGNWNGCLSYGNAEAHWPKLMRPLLGMTRRDIEHYATLYHVPYRTDRTNLENEYKRNKIRNLVFPVFEEINPSFIQTLGSDIAHFRQAADVLDHWVDSHRLEVTGTDPDGNTFISVSRLTATEDWEYLLYRILEEWGFNGSVAESLTGLIRSGKATFAGKTFTGEDHSIVTAPDRIIIFREIPETEYDISEYEYTPGMPLKCPPGVLIMDAGKVPADYIIRHWEDGDWLVPLGMKGRKKVSDLFTDLHLNLLQKQKSLVLATPGSSHVLAVLGLRIDDSVKVTPATEKIIKILSL